MQFESSLLAAISSVLPPDRPIALHEPDFKNTAAQKYLKDCLDSGWVSTNGKWVNSFEEYLTQITQAKHVIAVTNGTVALRLALTINGVISNEEVMMPSLSFVATANACSHLGAIPHFIDIEKETLGIDPIALQERLDQIAEKKNDGVWNKQTGRRIAAIVVVHVFGHPAQTTKLRAIANSWGVPLLEDAAEALGSFRENIHCGRFGKAGILSFNGNKLITTGGGGALLTDDDELAKHARHISTTSKIPHQWNFYHDEIGWNDRLPNINAALGVAQLEVLSQRISAKRKLNKEYAYAIKEISNVDIILEPINCTSNYWLSTIKLTHQDPLQASELRLKLLKEAHLKGLLLRPVWQPLHQLPMYINAPHGDLFKTEDQASRLINLPSSPQLLKR